MPVSEVEVSKALIKGAIAAITGNADPTVAATPIKAPGRTFQPPIDQKYFEIIPFLNGAFQTFWASGETFQGFARVILHWPTDDGGIYGPMALLAKVKAVLAKGTFLENSGAKLLIYDHPVIASPVENGQETLFPLTVRYQCFAAS